MGRSAVAMTISVWVRNIINKYNNPIPTFFSFVGKQVGVGDLPPPLFPTRLEVEKLALHPWIKRTVQN